jgi:hypothetical protein
MRYFLKQLRLAEKAAEDIYFAEVDRELIESLHKKVGAGEHPIQPSDRSSDEVRAANSPVVNKETGDV